LSVGRRERRKRRGSFDRVSAAVALPGLGKRDGFVATTQAAQIVQPIQIA